MSASLVGSEMCIRDSHAPVPCRSASGSATPSPLRHRVPARLRAPASAVSYTHLTLPTICSV
eukprot:6437939-Alexandrium_andersonii.AAC.1